MYLKKIKHSQPLNTEARFRLIFMYRKMPLYTALIYKLWNFESLLTVFYPPPYTGVKLFWNWSDIFYND